MRKSEPVLSANALAGVVLAILAVAGLNLTDVQANAVTQIVGALAVLVGPLLAAAVARKKVTPVDVSRQGDGFGPSNSPRESEILREQRPSGTTDPDEHSGKSP